MEKAKLFLRKFITCKHPSLVIWKETHTRDNAVTVFKIGNKRFRTFQFRIREINNKNC